MPAVLAVKAICRPGLWCECIDLFLQVTVCRWSKGNSNSQFPGLPTYFCSKMKSTLIFFLSSLLGSASALRTVTIGAALSSERNQEVFKNAVDHLNDLRLGGDVYFNSTSIAMDVNPIRSALDVCDRLLPQTVYTVIASHPNASDQSPISVSYTCGFYNIPVIGIAARDSAFSDTVRVVEHLIAECYVLGLHRLRAFHKVLLVFSWKVPWNSFTLNLVSVIMVMLKEVAMGYFVYTLS